jgi:hypothetical protein
MDNLHEGLPTFITIYRLFLRRMGNVSDKIVEKITTHVLCSITFFNNRTFYEIMWENIVKPNRRQKTVSAATDTHSECVLLTAFRGSHGYSNAPQYYVILILPALF